MEKMKRVSDYLKQSYKRLNKGDIIDHQNYGVGKIEHKTSVSVGVQFKNGIWKKFVHPTGYFKIIWSDIMVKDLILIVGDIISYPEEGFGKVTLTDNRLYPKIYADVVFWDGNNKFVKRVLQGDPKIKIVWSDKRFDIFK